MSAAACWCTLKTDRQVHAFLPFGAATDSFRRQGSTRSGDRHPPGNSTKTGISDGQWVWIETPRGKIKQRARLTDEVHPAMVRVQIPAMPGAEPSLHGVWESNSNVLCPCDPEQRNPEVGGWPHTALLCKVYAS